MFSITPVHRVLRSFTTTSCASTRNTQAKMARKYCTKPKFRKSELNKVPHSAPFDSNAAEPLELAPSRKTWVKAENIFTPLSRSKLSSRQMGTMEHALAQLSHSGLSTTTARVFRMRVFLLEEPLVQALATLQQIRPELMGTFEFRKDSPPQRYVDTFRAQNPSNNPPESEEMEPEASHLAKSLELEDEVEAPVPHTLIPIPLEIVEGADHMTFLNEFSNMLNVPFETGAPLLSVRTIRHPGGTDLIIAGHQSLFDEASFDAVCFQILDLYDIASEGRLNQTERLNTFPMLANIDLLYPTPFHEKTTQFASNYRLIREMNRLSTYADWHHVPYMDRDGNYGVRFPNYAGPAPEFPSPLASHTAVMFGSLSVNDSANLLDKCTKRAVSVEHYVTASVLQSVARVIHDTSTDISTKGHKRQPNGEASKSSVRQDDPRPGLWQRLRNLILGYSSTSPPKRESDEVPLIYAHLLSLRNWFEPDIHSPIIGALSAYFIRPTIVPLKRSTWKLAKIEEEAKVEANLTEEIFEHIAMTPRIARLSANERRWIHKSLPSVVISSPTVLPLIQGMQERYKIYDAKAAMSCWNPGICVSSQVFDDKLQLSISYRKPLVSDQIAHEILSTTLKTLTS